MSAGRRSVGQGPALSLKITMRIHIATDHAGMELSAFLARELSSLGYEVEYHGPKKYDALDDYPGFCIAAAKAVISDQEKGIEGKPLHLPEITTMPTWQRLGLDSTPTKRFLS